MCICVCVCVCVPHLDYNICFWPWTVSLGSYMHLKFPSKFMDLFKPVSDTLISSCVFVSLSCSMCVCQCVLFSWMPYYLHGWVTFMGLCHAQSNPLCSNWAQFSALYSLFQTGINIMFPHDGAPRITTALCYTQKSHKLTWQRGSAVDL